MLSVYGWTNTRLATVTDEQPSEHGGASPTRSAGRALGQSAVLDALLCLGVLAAIVLGQVRWVDAYWVALGAGVGRSVLAGLIAGISQWWRARWTPRASYGGRHRLG